MVLCQRPQGRATHEPISGHCPVVCGQLVNRQPKVIDVIELWCEIGRLLQADLGHPRLAGSTFDVLQHGVEDRPGEVRLGVGQACLVVCPCCLAQGKVTLALQVCDVHRPLPVRSVLQEVLGEHLDEVLVTSDQTLSILG